MVLIIKKKNHKSHCSCLCTCVSTWARNRGCTLVYVRTWLACVIGVKSVSYVVAWKTHSKLQHIYLKKRSCCSAWNVINTADGTFVIQNVFGRWNRLQTDAFMPPLTQKDIAAFSGDCNYRLRNQERLAPPVGISTVPPINTQMSCVSQTLLFLPIFLILKFHPWAFIHNGF